MKGSLCLISGHSGHGRRWLAGGGPARRLAAVAMRLLHHLTHAIHVADNDDDTDHDDDDDGDNNDDIDDEDEDITSRLLLRA